MHKKAIANLVDSIVKRVVAKANEAESEEPALEEAEARTLVGIYLRKNAGTIVDSVCGVEDVDES